MWESVSFHHVGPRNQTFVISLGSKSLHLLSPRKIFNLSKERIISIILKTQWLRISPNQGIFKGLEVVC